MKKSLFIFATFIFLLSNSAPAQKSVIYDQLTKTVKKGEVAKKHAISAGDYAKQSRQMNFARNQFSFCVEKAFGENYDASDETENARKMAADVKIKSEEIKCSGASIETDKAINNFIIAKENFREASNYLKTVKTTEDINEAYNSIASAKDAIEEAIKYLNLALKNLSDALLKLEECK